MLEEEEVEHNNMGLLMAVVGRMDQSLDFGIDTNDRRCCWPATTTTAVPNEEGAWQQPRGQPDDPRGVAVRLPVLALSDRTNRADAFILSPQDLMLSTLMNS